MHANTEELTLMVQNILVEHYGINRVARLPIVSNKVALCDNDECRWQDIAAVYTVIGSTIERTIEGWPEVQPAITAKLDLADPQNTAEAIEKFVAWL